MPNVTRPSLMVVVVAGSGVVCARATDGATNNTIINTPSRLSICISSPRRSPGRRRDSHRSGSAPNRRRATGRARARRPIGSRFRSEHRRSCSRAWDDRAAATAAVPCRPPRTDPPSTIITPAAPWSVPPLPFSEMRRPNSEKTITVVSLARPRLLHVAIERPQAIAERAHQVAVTAARGALFRVRVVAAGLHPVDARSDAVDDGAGHGAQRERESVVRVGRPSACRRAPPRLDRSSRSPIGWCCSRTRGAAGRERDSRPWLRAAARSSVAADAAVRARELVGARVRDRRHAGSSGDQRPRRVRGRVPCGQRVDRTRQRIEIAPEPTRSARRLRIRGAENVGGLEVRAARVLIPGALHHARGVPR